MESVKVVTTLHKDGYELYGKKFINTWTTYFPAHWEIDYYAENHTPLFSDRVNVLDFHSKCTSWTDFYNYVKTESNGLSNKEKNRLKKALRWSFKMFTLLHAMENSDTNYLIWLDSDVYAKQYPAGNWIQETLRDACVAGQLEHIKGFPHVETGILLINLKHKDITKLKNWIYTGYVEKMILTLPKPWDGAWIGKLFESKILHTRTIQILEINKTAQTFSSNSLRWLVHKVGDHKFPNDISGRSGRKESEELI